MKKILISSILFLTLSAHAQIDSTNELIDTATIKFIEPPDSRGFGAPDGQLVSKESSKCKINVYDEYKITVVKIIVKDGTSMLECGAGLEDTSSFKIRLYSGKVEISDEINVPPTLKKPSTCKPVT